MIDRLLILGMTAGLIIVFGWITYQKMDCRSRGGNEVRHGECYLMTLRRVGYGVDGQ